MDMSSSRGEIQAKAKRDSLLNGVDLTRVVHIYVRTPRHAICEPIVSSFPHDAIFLVVKRDDKLLKANLQRFPF